MARMSLGTSLAWMAAAAAGSRRVRMRWRWARAFGGGEGAEAFAVAGVGGGRGEEAVDEGSEVEAGASGDDGEMAALGDAGEGFAGLTAVVAGGAGLVGPDDVDHVVLDEGALFAGGLGGADLHLAVDGDGVATDDLAVEALGEVEGEGGFAAGGGADEDDEGGVVHHRRHQPCGVKTWCGPARRRLKARMARASRRRPRTWRRRSWRLRSASWLAVGGGMGYCGGVMLTRKSMRSSSLGPWKLAGSGGNWPTPVMAPQRGAVDGGVVGGAVEVHGPDAAVGEDGEADEGFALLVEGGTGLLGDEGDPGAADVAEDAAEVGTEVDALSVGEDFDAGVDAAVGDGGVGAVVAALAAVAGGLLGGLTDGIAGGGGGVAEVRLGGGGAGGVGEGLLLGWVLGERGWGCCWACWGAGCCGAGAQVRVRWGRALRLCAWPGAAPGSSCRGWA